MFYVFICSFFVVGVATAANQAYYNVPQVRPSHFSGHAVTHIKKDGGGQHFLSDFDLHQMADQYLESQPVDVARQPQFIWAPKGERDGGRLPVHHLNAEQPALPSGELTALQDLYTALNGKFWSWGSYGKPWDFSVATPSPCNGWDGITCTCNLTATEDHVNKLYNVYYYDDYASHPQNFSRAHCNIYKIYLSKHNLTGTLPASLFSSFKNLSRLHLGFNHIVGEIPSYFPPPLLAPPPDAALQVLELSYNRIQGPIPMWIGNLRNLEVLDLQQNSLSKTMPSNLGKTAQALEFLNFVNNSLTGTIPESICNLSRLKVMVVIYNSADGTIPSCMGSLVRLVRLSLRENKFTGTFPTFFSSLVNLELLGLANNAFPPSRLSSSLQSLKKLKILNFYNAKLYGTIPDLSGLTNLEELRLDGNNLEGTIPSFFCDLKKVRSFRLESNSLEGSLPSCLGQNQPRLQEISLFSNVLSGTIPRELSRITTLVSLLLGNNNLRGNLAGLFNPTAQLQLQYVDISQNGITSSLPRELFQLRNLSILATSLNCMTGTIPDSICQANELQSLFLVGVKLSSVCTKPLLSIEYQGYHTNVAGSQGLHGSLPACLLTLPHLQSLAISGNALTGSISPSRGLGPFLTEISLSHNQFTGTIPVMVQLRSTWKLLDLAFNRFTGTLAPDMKLHSSCKLVLIVNNLSGKVPKGLLPQTDINILEGNSFACSDDITLSSKTNLPRADPSFATVGCGSDDANLATFIWIAGFAVYIILLYFVFNLLLKEEKAKNAAVLDIQSRISETLWEPIRGSIFSHQVSQDSSQQRSRFSAGGDAHTADHVDNTVERTSINPIISGNGIISSSDVEHAVQFPQISASLTFSSKLCWVLAQLDPNQLFIKLAGYNVDVFDVRGIYAVDDRLCRCISEFEEVMRSLRWVCLWLTFLLLFVYLPVLYIPLSFYFGTLTFEAAWTVSATYLQGQSAAIALLFGLISVLILLSVLIAYSLRNRLHHLDENDARITAWRSSRGMMENVITATFSDKALHRCSLFIVALLDIILVVSVNVGYIFATLSIEGLYLGVISLSLSVFKLGMTTVVVPWAVSQTDKLRKDTTEISEQKQLDRDNRSLTVQAVICILNNIVIPCFATIIISPDCARYVFFDPPKVAYTYSIPQCILYNIDTLKCISIEPSPHVLTFVPPFDYGYECSSTLLTTYAVVYVYTFFMISFVVPFLGIVMFFVRRKVSEQAWGHKRYQIVHDLATAILSLSGPVHEDHVVPAYQRVVFSLSLCEICRKEAIDIADMAGSDSPAEECTPVPHCVPCSNHLCKVVMATSSLMKPRISNTNKRKTVYFNKLVFLISVFQVLCIMFSFGVIFPPLCLMGMVAIFVKTFVIQVLVRRFIEDATNAKRKTLSNAALVSLREDFEGVWVLFKNVRWWLFRCASGFYGFFVFDVLGTVVGALDAFSVLVVLSVMPGIIYVISRIVKSNNMVRRVIGLEIHDVHTKDGRSDRSMIGVERFSATSVDDIQMTTLEPQQASDVENTIEESKAARATVSSQVSGTISFHDGPL